MSAIPRLVDLNWPPDRIREFCEQNDNWVLDLPADWSSSDVEALYRRQVAAKRPYVGVIVEIAGDSRVSEATLVDISTRFGSELEIASALATNPATPERLLQELAEHDDITVKEHAQQTMRRRSRGEIGSDT